MAGVFSWAKPVKRMRGFVQVLPDGPEPAVRACPWRPGERFYRVRITDAIGGDRPVWEVSIPKSKKAAARLTPQAVANAGAGVLNEAIGYVELTRWEDGYPTLSAVYASNRLQVLCLWSTSPEEAPAEHPAAKGWDQVPEKFRPHPMLAVPFIRIPDVVPAEKDATMIDQASDAAERWQQMARLHQEKTEASEAVARIKGDLAAARKREREAEDKLGGYIKAQLRPMPLFDRPANGHVPQPLREQPPLRPPSIESCVVGEDLEEEAIAAELAQPSQGPARRAAAKGERLWLKDGKDGWAFIPRTVKAHFFLRGVSVCKTGWFHEGDMIEQPARQECCAECLRKSPVAAPASREEDGSEAEPAPAPPARKPGPIDVEAVRLRVWHMDGEAFWPGGPSLAGEGVDPASEKVQRAWRQLMEYPAWWGTGGDRTAKVESNIAASRASGLPETEYDISTREAICRFRALEGQDPDWDTLWAEFVIAMPGALPAVTALWKGCGVNFSWEFWGPVSTTGYRSVMGRQADSRPGETLQACAERIALELVQAHAGAQERKPAAKKPRKAKAAPSEPALAHPTREELEAKDPGSTAALKERFAARQAVLPGTEPDDRDRWQREVRDPAEAAVAAEGNLARHPRSGKERARFFCVPIPGGWAAKWNGGGMGAPWRAFPAAVAAANAFKADMVPQLRSAARLETGRSRDDTEALAELLEEYDADAILALPLLPADGDGKPAKDRKPAAPEAPMLPGMPRESDAERAARLMPPSLLDQAAARAKAQPGEEPLPPPRPDARLLGEGTVGGARLAVWLLPCGAIEASARFMRLGNWSRNDLMAHEYDPTVEEISEAASKAARLAMAAVDWWPDEAAGEMRISMAPERHPEPWLEHSLAGDAGLLDWVAQCWADNGVRCLGVAAQRLKADPTGKSLKKVARGRLTVLLASTEECWRRIAGSVPPWLEGVQ